VRGIEARRRDTPLFIKETQMHILEILANAPDVDHLKDHLQEVERYVQRQLKALRDYRVPLEDLLVRQRLSRELEDYRSPSPAAKAARQLSEIGFEIRPGQSVRFLWTLVEPGVYAWDLSAPPVLQSIDINRYKILLERALQAILDPIQSQADIIMQLPVLF
jgi:DNA polymerase-2